jgi:CBS domain-containing protein
MALGFHPDNAPYDRLTAPQIETVRATLDIGYFRPGETILQKRDMAMGRAMAEALPALLKFIGGRPLVGY